MALPTVLTVAGVLLFSFGLLFGFVGFRKIINYKISKVCTDLFLYKIDFFLTYTERWRTVKVFIELSLCIK